MIKSASFYLGGGLIFISGSERDTTESLVALAGPSMAIISKKRTRMNMNGPISTLCAGAMNSQSSHDCIRALRDYFLREWKNTACFPFFTFCEISELVIWNQLLLLWDWILLSISKHSIISQMQFKTDHWKTIFWHRDIFYFISFDAVLIYFKFILY